jgi:hypothetical protein
MSDVSETRVFDEIVSTSLDLYMKTLTDNVFKETPAMYEIKRKGCYQPESGGIQIVEPLMYGKNSTVKSYERYDTLDLSPQEGITSTLWPWSQVAGSVIIDGLSEFQNAGKGNMISLVSAKIMQLEMSFQEQFAAYMFGLGRYNQSRISATKDPTGLTALIQEVAGTYDVGGVDCSVETWWENRRVGNGGSTFTWIDSTSARATGVAAMTVLYNNCSKGTGGSPDVALCSQALFQNYETNLATLKYMETLQDTEAAAAGFQNLKFRGCTLYWDEQFRTTTCTDPDTINGLIFLNSKFLRMRYAANMNFKRTPWMTPQNQDARSCLILWYGNTTLSNRRKHGVLAEANLTNH